MKNKILEDGNMQPYTNGGAATLAAGSLVHLGNGRCGIVQDDIAVGATGVLDCHGVFKDVPKAAAVAYTVGEVPAIGTAGNTISKTSTALTTTKNVVVWEASTTAQTTIKIKLLG